MPWIALVPDISGVCSIVGTFEITSKPTNTASTKIVISVIRSPLMRSTGSLDRFPHALVDDLAVVRDAAAGGDLVLEVEVQLALRREVLEQVRDVVRVQQAGVERHLARQVERAVDRHAVALDHLARLGQLAVAAGLGREVDDHRARPHRAHHLRGDQLRRRPAGHGGGRDHARRRAATRSASSSLLAALLVLRQLLRVLAGAEPSPSCCTSICTNLAPRLSTSSFTAGRTS